MAMKVKRITLKRPVMVAINRGEFEDRPHTVAARGLLVAHEVASFDEGRELRVSAFQAFTLESGTVTAWEVGTLKKGYDEWRVTFPENYKAAQAALWSLVNREPLRLTIRADNIDAITDEEVS